MNFLLFVPLSTIIFVMPFVSSSAPAPEGTTANNANALKQGYPLFVVRLMLAYQHLTICTMTTTALYIVLSGAAHYSGQPSSSFICSLRLVLPGAGAIVAQFWTFILVFGPWSLVTREDFPADDKKAKWLIERLFLRPSRTKHCFFFVLMHVQHTWMPLLPWIEQGLFSASSSWPHRACPEPSLGDECWAVVRYLFAWLVWGLFIWNARKNPPYPMLRTAWRQGTWPLLYGTMTALALGAAALSSTMRRRGAFLVS